MRLRTTHPPLPRHRRSRILRMTLAITALALLLAACTQDLPQNSWAPAGPEAERQADLFWFVFWIAVAVFVIVEGLLIVILIRFRRRGDDDQPVQVHGNTRLEALWTIIPAVLLAWVAVPTIAGLFELAREPTGDVVQVEVTGHQWWWEVEYPELGVVTANEIHIPTETPVNVTLRSADVIHSFWVPRLAGKQDLVPGSVERLHLEASEPGVYWGTCAEYCGLSHANMRFRVMAQTAAEFQSWVEDQRRPAAEPGEGTLELEGQEIFSGTCIACHLVRGLQEPPEGTVPAPDLTHAGSRQTLAAGIMDMDAEDLARWLRNPPGEKPGSRMQDYQLTDPQIDALVAYLLSLR